MGRESLAASASALTLREALEDVLGPATLDRLVQHLGIEWAVLASRVEVEGAWSEGARALAGWPERRERAWEAVSAAKPDHQGEDSQQH